MPQLQLIDVPTGYEHGATFSVCGRYRYRLWRLWDHRPRLCFVMLNPSSADADINDPTVARCEERGRRAGFGGIVVVNLFGFGATDPAEMKRAEDPVGPENDQHILEATREAGVVVCAWGNHGSHRGRSAEVRALLARHGIACHALRVSEKTGEPWHPLYLGYDIQPQPWPL